MIDRAHPALSVSRQCHLLEVSRASVYRRPAPVSAEDLRLMELIDRQYLAHPFYGSRRMAAWLTTQGFPVNRKRVAAPDAADGTGGDLSAPQHQQGDARAHQVPGSPRRPDHRPRQPGLVQ
jgi:hypothetical protein